VFLDAVGEFLMSADKRKAVNLMLAKTEPITDERHKDIQPVMCDTDMHKTARNSALCRMMCGRMVQSPEFLFPADVMEYETVAIEVVGINHTDLAAALHSELEEEFSGEGESKDPQRGKVRVTDMRILPGPKAATHCKGEEEVLTHAAAFKLAWCKNVREALTGDREIKVNGNTIKMSMKLLLEQMFTLNRNTTVEFLAACKALGLAEAEASVDGFSAAPLALQLALDSAILNGKSIAVDIATFPAVASSFFEAGALGNVPFYVTFLMFSSLQGLTAGVAEEGKKGLSHSLFMVGISPMVYWAAWFTALCIKQLIMSFLCIFILSVITNIPNIEVAALGAGCITGSTISTILSLSFSVFLCMSLSFSVRLFLSLSFSVCLCPSQSVSVSLCPSLSLSVSVCL
jgi:hypothetical protein